MGTLTTTEKITKLKQELADLEAQERAEKEETRKKLVAEREVDLKNIKDAITAFNKKHDECLRVVQCDIHVYNDFMGMGHYVEKKYIEV